MKKIAKLTIYFSLTFVIIFAAVTGIKFVSLRVEWASILPPKPETSLSLLIAAAHWALSLTLFSTIAISLNYAVRRNVFSLAALICTITLSFAFSFGISTALEQWKLVPPAQTAGIPLGEKGLILSNAINSSETAVILLNGTDEPLGPRVIAIPGQPLTYQKSAAEGFDLPPVPFGNDTPWFLNSLIIDIRLNAELFQKKYSQGFFSYLFYVGSLIFMLCSLGYLLKFSVWPLANLFIAILIFRGVLALNTFVNSAEMQEIISSFLDGKLPASAALPLVYLAFGILINAYSLLVYAAKRRADDDI